MQCPTAQPGISFTASETDVDAEVEVEVPAAPRPWVLYLLRCAGDRLYAGITNDLDARVAAHRAGRGARFTRAFPPEDVVLVRAFPDRSAALKAEYALKQRPRHEKIAFLGALGEAVEPSSAPVVAAAILVE